MRDATINRKTNETEIDVQLAVDGTGRYEVATGIGFFDHMLEQLAKHSGMDITVKATGDLHIDGHHTVEDVGIALGQALARALGDRRGITRYAHAYLPMDEALTRVAVDISGRPMLVFDVPLPTGMVGTFDLQLTREFFGALVTNAGITMHIDTLRGINSHHIVESCFKGVARALGAAVKIDRDRADTMPSTKGSLAG